jgi:hypothetical protein
MVECTYTPAEVVDDICDVIERHDLTNIQAMAVISALILHILELQPEPGEMLEEALPMTRESVARHLTH